MLNNSRLLNKVWSLITFTVKSVSNYGILNVEKYYYFYVIRAKILCFITTCSSINTEYSQKL